MSRLWSNYHPPFHPFQHAAGAFDPTGGTTGARNNDVASVLMGRRPPYTPAPYVTEARRPSLVGQAVPAPPMGLAEKLRRLTGGGNWNVPLK